MEVDLKNLLPEWFKSVLDFHELMDTESIELEKLENDLRLVWNNLHIQTADEDTISVFEKRFGIVYHYGETLDYRRARVMQKYNTIVPFTIGFLKSRLAELYSDSGYTLSVNPSTCTITISVTSDRYGAIDLLYDLIWDILPAHIKIISIQQVTNYIAGDIYASSFLCTAKIQRF